MALARVEEGEAVSREGGFVVIIAFASELCVWAGFPSDFVGLSASALSLTSPERRVASGTGIVRTLNTPLTENAFLKVKTFSHLIVPTQNLLMQDLLIDLRHGVGGLRNWPGSERWRN